MDRMRGKVAIVTGAGKGIGAAIARLLAAEGCKVLVAGRTEADVTAVARDIGSNAAGCVLDVSSRSDWRAAIDKTAQRWGKLNVLVNNAGASEPGSIENTSEESWRRQLSTNLDGVYYGCEAALPLMKTANEPCSIVNIGSAFCLRPMGAYLAYGASKAGMTALTKSVALHCAASGYPIRANVVHPGGTETPMLERNLTTSRMQRDDAYAVFARMHPMARYGKPEEVAQACLWLASEESSFTTGCDVTVDGGMSIRS